MTIILTCTTPTHIIQASDRRLTWKDGVIADNSANKTVAFMYDNVFGYTGISEVKDKTRIDQWIVNTLDSKLNLEENLQKIQKQLNIDSRPNDPLAIVCACWATTTPGEKHSPHIIVISNFYDDNGNVSKKLFKRFRRTNLMFNTSVEICFHEVGTPTSCAVGVDVRKEIKLNIKKYKKKYGGNHMPPKEMAKLMVYGIRTLSDRLIKKTVGKDITITIIPNRENKNIQKNPTIFEYYPENSNDSTCYIPASITKNGKFHYMKIRNLKEGEFEELIKKTNKLIQRDFQKVHDFLHSQKSRPF